MVELLKQLQALSTCSCINIVMSDALHVRMDVEMRSPAMLEKLVSQGLLPLLLKLLKHWDCSIVEVAVRGLSKVASDPLYSPSLLPELSSLLLIDLLTSTTNRITKHALLLLERLCLYKETSADTLSLLSSAPNLVKIIHSIVIFDDMGQPSIIHVSGIHIVSLLAQSNMGSGWPEMKTVMQTSSANVDLMPGAAAVTALLLCAAHTDDPVVIAASEVLSTYNESRAVNVRFEIANSPELSVKAAGRMEAIAMSGPIESASITASALAIMVRAGPSALAKDLLASGLVHRVGYRLSSCMRGSSASNADLHSCSAPTGVYRAASSLRRASRSSRPSTAGVRTNSADFGLSASQWRTLYMELGKVLLAAVETQRSHLEGIVRSNTFTNDDLGSISRRSSVNQEAFHGSAGKSQSSISAVPMYRMVLVWLLSTQDSCLISCALSLLHSLLVLVVERRMRVFLRGHECCSELWDLAGTTTLLPLVGAQLASADTTGDMMLALGIVLAYGRVRDARGARPAHVSAVSLSCGWVTHAVRLLSHSEPLVVYIATLCVKEHAQGIVEVHLDQLGSPPSLVSRLSELVIHWAKEALVSHESPSTRPVPAEKWFGTYAVGNMLSSFELDPSLHHLGRASTLSEPLESVVGQGKAGKGEDEEADMCRMLGNLVCTTDEPLETSICQDMEGNKEERDGTCPALGNEGEVSTRNESLERMPCQDEENKDGEACQILDSLDVGSIASEPPKTPTGPDKGVKEGLGAQVCQTPHWALAAAAAGALAALSACCPPIRAETITRCSQLAAVAVDILESTNRSVSQSGYASQVEDTTQSSKAGDAVSGSLLLPLLEMLQSCTHLQPSIVDVLPIEALVFGIASLLSLPVRPPTKSETLHHLQSRASNTFSLHLLIREEAARLLEVLVVASSDAQAVLARENSLSMLVAAVRIADTREVATIRHVVGLLARIAHADNSARSLLTNSYGTLAALGALDTRCSNSSEQGMAVSQCTLWLLDYLTDMRVYTEEYIDCNITLSHECDPMHSQSGAAAPSPDEELNTDEGIGVMRQRHLLSAPQDMPVPDIQELESVFGTSAPSILYDTQMWKSLPHATSIPHVFFAPETLTVPQTKTRSRRSSHDLGVHSSPLISPGTLADSPGHGGSDGGNVVPGVTSRSSAPIASSSQSSKSDLECPVRTYTTAATFVERTRARFSSTVSRIRRSSSATLLAGNSSGGTAMPWSNTPSVPVTPFLVRLLSHNHIPFAYQALTALLSIAKDDVERVVEALFKDSERRASFSGRAPGIVSIAKLLQDAAEEVETGGAAVAQFAVDCCSLLVYCLTYASFAKLDVLTLLQPVGPSLIAAVKCSALAVSRAVTATLATWVRISAAANLLEQQCIMALLADDSDAIESISTFLSKVVQEQLNRQSTEIHTGASVVSEMQTDVAAALNSSSILRHLLISYNHLLPLVIEQGILEGLVLWLSQSDIQTSEVIELCALTKSLSCCINACQADSDELASRFGIAGVPQVLLKLAASMPPSASLAALEALTQLAGASTAALNAVLGSNPWETLARILSCSAPGHQPSVTLNTFRPVTPSAIDGRSASPDGIDRCTTSGTRGSRRVSPYEDVRLTATSLLQLLAAEVERAGERGGEHVLAAAAAALTWDPEGPASALPPSSGLCDAVLELLGSMHTPSAAHLMHRQHVKEPLALALLSQISRQVRFVRVRRFSYTAQPSTEVVDVLLTITRLLDELSGEVHQLSDCKAPAKPANELGLFMASSGQETASSREEAQDEEEKRSGAPSSIGVSYASSAPLSRDNSISSRYTASHYTRAATAPTMPCSTSSAAAPVWPLMVRCITPFLSPQWGCRVLEVAARALHDVSSRLGRVETSSGALQAAVPSLLALMSHESPSVVRHALSTLAMVSERQCELQEMLTKPEVASELVRLLSNLDLSIMREAMVLLYQSVNYTLLDVCVTPTHSFGRQLSVKKGGSSNALDLPPDLDLDGSSSPISPRQCYERSEVMRQYERAVPVIERLLTDPRIWPAMPPSTVNYVLTTLVSLSSLQDSPLKVALSSGGILTAVVGFIKARADVDDDRIAVEGAHAPQSFYRPGQTVGRHTVSRTTSFTSTLSTAADWDEQDWMPAAGEAIEKLSELTLTGFEQVTGTVSELLGLLQYLCSAALNAAISGEAEMDMGGRSGVGEAVVGIALSTVRALTDVLTWLAAPLPAPRRASSLDGLPPQQSPRRTKSTCGDRHSTIAADLMQRIADALPDLLMYPDGSVVRLLLKLLKLLHGPLQRDTELLRRVTTAVCRLVSERDPSVAYPALKTIAKILGAYESVRSETATILCIVSSVMTLSNPWISSSLGLANGSSYLSGHSSALLQTELSVSLSGTVTRSLPVPQAPPLESAAGVHVLAHLMQCREPRAQLAACQLSSVLARSRLGAQAAATLGLLPHLIIMMRSSSRPPVVRAAAAAVEALAGVDQGCLLELENVGAIPQFVRLLRQTNDATTARHVAKCLEHLVRRSAANSRLAREHGAVDVLHAWLHPRFLISVELSVDDEHLLLTFRAKEELGVVGVSSSVARNYVRLKMEYCHSEMCRVAVVRVLKVLLGIATNLEVR